MIISTYLRDQLQNGEISINQAREFIGQEEMQLDTAYQPMAKKFQWFLFLSSMISLNLSKGFQISSLIENPNLVP